MRAIFSAAAMFAALAACSPNAPAAPSAEAIAKNSADLVAYLDAEYEEEMQASPQEMTAQGRKERYGELDDRSEAAMVKDLEWRRESVAEMKAKFAPDALSEDARLSYEIWELELGRAEKAAEFRRHRYIFGRGGAHTGLVNFMVNQHRVDEKSDVEAYISRVNAIGPTIDVLIDRAKLAAADGIRMPGFAYDMTTSEVARVTTGFPFTRSGGESALYADGAAKIKALAEAGKLKPEEAVALTEQLRLAMVEKMQPAYQRLAAWIAEDKVNASATPQGAGSLPNGEAYYNAMLNLMTTTDMTADEIHQLGLSEVARIRGEMEKVKEQAGFTGTLEEFFVFMRTDKQFYLPNNDAGAQEYIDRATRHIEEMKLKLPEYFGRLPKADLIVKRVEPYREEPGGAQHYQSGTPDGSRPGIYYAHLSDMNAMATYMLEDIAYHEGLPGHHMQISIQQELEAETGPNKLPKFRTQYGYTAYSEGWGLYSEALSKEMGFLKDPYSHYGQLSGEIWRAIRLVLDTGIHSKGWTEEQAVKYFTDNSSIPEAAIASEVRRYITTAGQATAYKIGMIKLQQMRDKARTELGDKFSYPAFHDQILGGGALPLPVLEAKIDRWIASQKKAA
ncbi:MAG: DUF885 domain-containing protein [Hyphomonadaceae bacterium]|nr:DUF885 domain-containing protein [Hyphomonadaceae bacterium]